MRCGRAAHPSFKGKSTLRSIPRPSRLAAPAERCRVQLAVGFCNGNVDAYSCWRNSKAFRSLDNLLQDCNPSTFSSERRTPSLTMRRASAATPTDPPCHHVLRLGRLPPTSKRRRSAPPCRTASRHPAAAKPCLSVLDCTSHMAKGSPERRPSPSL